MADENEEGSQVADQAGPSEATQPGETTGEGQAGASPAVGETQGEQASSQQSALAQGEQKVDIGPKELPAELVPLKQQLLNDYYAKTREVAEQRGELKQTQEKAGYFDTLWNYPRFQDWLKAEQAQPGSGNIGAQGKEMSQEQLQEMQDNPAKFQSWFEGIVDRAIQTKLGPSMSQTKEQLEQISLDKEIDAMEIVYPDFKKVADAGLLDPIFDEAEKQGRDISYEDAYGIYNLRNPGNVDATIAQKATDMVNKSKLGATEKPGGIPKPGSRVVKVKNSDEAFDALFEAKVKGENIKLEKA